ncbi:dihydroorotase [Proteiniclasticum ruminis]|uniref:dihydroorotase n=1 Tax=Proteiniclasticum ruminis TaxID=398199 RepID=UPI00289C62BA|nr:dihydroorotase [Proteiniclasticum ruminis]
MIITNVTMIDAHKEVKGSLVIEDGLIKDVLPEQVPSGDHVIDGKGYALLPAFVDLHTHLREPGFPEKEDMESGMRAALKGGFVHLTAMANTKPVTDSKEKVLRNLEKAKKLSLCDLTQVSAVTEEFQNTENALVDFQSLRSVTTMFSNDGKNLDSMEAMEKALEYSKELDFTVSCHCEPEAEYTKKYLELNSRIGGNLHICHVSEKETVDLIRAAKRQGIKVTCEVTPHHLFAHSLPYKVHPPFAKEEDVKALIEGIKDGTIDHLATDHAPHTAKDKLEGMPGLSNIEYAFSMYHTVFQENDLSVSKLVELLSENPAKKLGLPMGSFEKGKEANFVLVDLHKIIEINPNEMISRGKNTPFAGRRILGQVKLTMKRGEIYYDHR